MHEDELDDLLADKSKGRLDELYSIEIAETSSKICANGKTEEK